MSLKTWQGVWRLVDPKITLAPVASMLVGISRSSRSRPARLLD